MRNNFESDFEKSWNKIEKMQKIVFGLAAVIVSGVILTFAIYGFVVIKGIQAVIDSDKRQEVLGVVSEFSETLQGDCECPDDKERK